MRYGKDQKQATRQRILEAAGRRFKQEGIDGAGCREEHDQRRGHRQPGLVTRRHGVRLSTSITAACITSRSLTEIHGAALAGGNRPVRL